MDINFDDFFTKFDSDTMMNMMMGDVNHKIQFQFQSMFSSMFMGGGRGGRVRYPGKAPKGFNFKTSMGKKPKAKTEEEEWETEEEEDIDDAAGTAKVDEVDSKDNVDDAEWEDQEWEDEYETSPFKVVNSKSIIISKNEQSHK